MTGVSCGDEVLDDGEACDKGGEDPECDDDCTAVECGDGNINEAAGESCEEARPTEECESATCKAPECGDGYVNLLAEEECDDGNTSNSDGCSAMCVIERRVVFLSSDPVQGCLGGLQGADKHCQGLADKAGLPGTFMAWLSDGTNGPKTRFMISPNFSGPFQLPDGTPVANGWAGLTSGFLLNAINKDENGAKTSATVWTNTNADGTPRGPDHCQNWTITTNSKLGHRGLSEFLDLQWTDYDYNVCNSPSNLYCIQVQ